MTFSSLKESTDVLTDNNIRIAIALLQGDEMKLGYLKADKVENKDVTIKLLDNEQKQSKT